MVKPTTGTTMETTGSCFFAWFIGAQAILANLTARFIRNSEQHQASPQVLDRAGPLRHLSVQIHFLFEDVRQVHGFAAVA